MQNNDRRIKYIDSLKGFAIILVVLGHIADGYLFSGMMSDRSQLFRDIYNGIYTFHMPLFIVISGYLYEKAYFKKNNTYRKLLIQIVSLVVLYIGFSLFHAILKISFYENSTGDVSLDDVWNIWKEPIAPFWYIYILIIFYIVFIVIRRLNNRWMISILLLINLLGNIVKEESLNFEIYRVMYYGLFFGLGIAYARDSELLFFDKRMSRLLLLVGLLFCGIYWYDSAGRFINGIPYVNTVVAMAFVSYIWCFFEAKVNSESSKLINTLSSIGLYSLEIYVLHILFTSTLRVWMKDMDSRYVWIAIGLNWTLSIVMPILISVLLKKVHLHDIIFRPLHFLAISARDVKKREIEKTIAAVALLVGCVCILGVLLCVWVNIKYGKYSVADIVLYQKLPMTHIKAVNSAYVKKWIIAPLFTTAFIIGIIYRLVYNKRHSIIIYVTVMVALVIMLIGIMAYTVNRFPQNTKAGEDRIYDNFINPYNEELTIGDNRHNLVYLYINDESFSAETIDNEVSDYRLDIFSNQIDNQSVWEESVIFGENMGLPLQIGWMQGSVTTRNNFFDGIYGLGDILQLANYNNLLFTTSEDTCKDYHMLYSRHGNYEKKISTDSTEYIKEVVDLLKQDGSFNIQVIDPELTGEGIKDLIKKLDSRHMLAGSTIVICNKASKGIDTYIINSAVVGDGISRETSIYDMLPTVYESLGGSMRDSQLGLGTSAYSDRRNMLETYGRDACVDYYKSPSEFIMNEYQSGINKWFLDKAYKEYDVYYEQEDDGVRICGVFDFEASGFRDFKGFEAEYWFDDSDDRHIVHLDKVDFIYNTYKSDVLTNINIERHLNIDYYLVSESGIRYRIRTDNDVDISNYDSDLKNYIIGYNDSNHIIFVAVRDDASSRITDRENDTIRYLGNNTSLHDGYRNSYIMVVDGGRLEYEEMMPYSLSYDGKIGGSMDYSITSEGYDCGDKCSIKIDNIEYSFNSRGINIVVYDKMLGKVVNSSCYDTNDGVTYKYRSY